MATAERHVEAPQNPWDGIANGYDEFVTPSHFWLGNEGLRRLGLERGMRFLDVAAGSGGLSIPAARLGARVLSTDLSPVMLERLAARAVAEDLAIETRVMDGHALDLEDATFDAAGSQFGVMLFPDMPRGIREMARVTRPGGRVLMTVYGPPSKIEFFGAFVRAVQAAVPGFTGPAEEPLPFQLQDPKRLHRELETAGLRDVRVETTAETLSFRSGAELWGWLVNSNPVVGGILAQLRLTDAQITVARRAIDALIDERARDGVARLTNPVHIGTGTR